MTTKGFLITGRAAHERIARLFIDLVNKEKNSNDEWVDLSPYAAITTTNSTQSHEPSNDANETTNNSSLSKSNVSIEFLWENSPRHTTKGIRDKVSVYSHLPNGTSVLDDKWVLARLLGSSSFVNVDDDEVGDNDKASGRIQSTVNKNAGDESDVLLATLESHCFRGADFATFAHRVGLFSQAIDKTPGGQLQYQFDDLMERSNATKLLPPPPPDNLWVIKDAMSNGAGGIWIVDSSNARDFLVEHDTSTTTTSSSNATPTNNSNNNNNNSNESILHPTHRYIAQQYAWPPTLFHGRKCHVRVYGCINHKGEAYIHHRAFLHVANDVFTYEAKGGGGGFEPSVHITNCCANSHDVTKFSGEICVDLLETSSTAINGNSNSNQMNNRNSNDIIPLGRYFPSIAASLAELAKKSYPFLKGGGANAGFEYLGMDFVLSSIPSNNNKSETDNSNTERVPVAYLLEVNAPPSQDTATGLSHAEELHDEVLTDLLKMCVLPQLGVGSSSGDCGGWQCVYRPESNDELSNETAAVVPSKAAFVNRVRWNMFEKRAAEEYESYWSKQTTLRNEQHGKSQCESSPAGDLVSFDHDAFIRFVRSQFPYLTLSKEVFFESGGGSQVPQIVIDSMVSSLTCRDRSVVGSQCLYEARRALLSLLTGVKECNRYRRSDHDYNLLFLGHNATSLLDRLAQQCFGNAIEEGDEIILASENHLANVLPWIALAKRTGAVVKWWTVSDTKTNCPNESCVLSDLITSRTKLVAISHASNILGCVRDIPSICRLVRCITSNLGQVVVDGVAAAPHLLSPEVFQDDQPDWYVASLHKMFGPHMGCLIGQKGSLRKLLNLHCASDNELHKLLEMGTMNYEACAGGIALEKYFQSMESELAKLANNNEGKCCARLAIQSVERRLVNHLLNTLTQSTSSVHVIQDLGHQRIGYDDDPGNSTSRLPFVSFTHARIKPNLIVKHCRSHGVICRACKFLSSDRLWKEIGVEEEALVRFSLVHYNTFEEIDRAIEVLSMIDSWA